MVQLRDNIHITHEFQFDTFGFKVIKESELKSHIHVKCENCKTILGDAFDLEYYKDKLGLSWAKLSQSWGFELEL